MDQTDVVIVGAGVVGLAVAVEMSRRYPIGKSCWWRNMAGSARKLPAGTAKSSTGACTIPPVP